jgi:phosphohistidine phosphatase SixA
VRVLLVRHGCAGDKRRWDGPDDERPLDEVGVRQSEALAEATALTGARRLGTSPTRRCRDTLVPLGLWLGLPVEDLDVLRVDAPVDALLGLLTAPSSRDAVFCTHGEVMSGLLEVLVGAGTPVEAEWHDEGWLLAKGSGWELSVDEAAGRVSRVRHVRPDGLVTCEVHNGAARPRTPGPGSPGSPGSPGGDRR